MPEVKLKQPHTHQGKRVAAGETITVTEAEEVWLREHEIIGVAPVVNDSQSNRGRNKQQEPEDNGTV